MMCQVIQGMVTAQVVMDGSGANGFINPFAPGDFAEKRVLKLVDWFSGHCRAIKS